MLRKMRCFSKWWLLFYFVVKSEIVLNFTTNQYGSEGEYNETSEETTTTTTTTTTEHSDNFNLSIDLKFATECETPNHDPGYCVEIRLCPKLLKQLSNLAARDFIVASKCGPFNEDLKYPKVCCGKYNNYKQVTLLTVDDSSVFPKRCGRQHQMIMRSRILGGTKAAIGEFPWMARLVHKNDKGFSSVGCSGFLVHTKYVLTAAHCVHKDFTRIRGPVFSVILGEHNTETKIDCNPGGTHCADPLQISRVDKVIVHHGYDVESSAHYNDIAIIHMKKAARLTEFVEPICLLTQRGPEIPENYVISGWGKTERELFSKIKMKVEIPSVNQTECKEKYSVLNIELADSQICAGGEEGRDSCSGDSGGPLMLENGTHYLAAGLVSFGIGCGNKGWPGVYISIPSYVQWIKEQIITISSVNTKNPRQKKHHKKKNSTNIEPPY